MKMPTDQKGWDDLVEQLLAEGRTENHTSSVEYIYKNLKKGMTHEQIEQLRLDALKIHERNLQNGGKTTRY